MINNRASGATIGNIYIYIYDQLIDLTAEERAVADSRQGGKSLNSKVKKYAVTGVPAFDGWDSASVSGSS